jgi:hypothetical protein
MFRGLFTDKAGKILHNRIHNTVHQRNEQRGHIGLFEFLSRLNVVSAKTAIDEGKVGWKRVMDMTIAIGLSCNKTSMSMAIAKVAHTVNDLADKDHITGSMMPLSIIRLDKMIDNERQYIVASYVSLKTTGETYVEQNLKKLVIGEGSMPNSIEDVL